MITRPTVLVLGAGASHEFGFPLGRELLLNVCSALSSEAHTAFQRLHELGHRPDFISKFRRELYYSMQPSVDAFLELRPEYTDVGKAAIACGLIPGEDEQRLYRNPNRQSWYEYLFTRLATSLDAFRRNRLAILTFNYDRSLEHFLFLALKHSYDLSDQKTAESLKMIEIIHLQGLLGELPYLAEKDRPYNSELTPESLRIAASGIRVVHEKMERDPAFARAHELLASAEIVAFLGFAYHPTNMARLRCRELHKGGQLYVGTAFGIKAGEKPVIARSLPDHVRLGDQDEDVAEFIRQDTFMAVATKPEKVAAS